MNINSNTINKINTEELNIFIKDVRFSLMMAKKDRVDYVYNTSCQANFKTGQAKFEKCYNLKLKPPLFFQSFL